MNSLKCEKCGSENRSIAKYCKKCGEGLYSAATTELESLVGLSSVKNEVSKIVGIYNAIRSRQSGSGAKTKINLHTLIIGNTGTGKSQLVNVLQQLYFRHKIITKPTVYRVDAVDYPDFSDDFQNNIKKAKGGILFIDNAQKLVPGGYATDINLLDKLFSEMEHFDCDPIVVLAGLPSGFEEFLRKNPSIRNRFEYFFRLPDFTNPELFLICETRLSSYHLHLSDEAAKRLKALFKQAYKTKDDTFGNAHYSLSVAEEIFKVYLSRVAKGAKDDNIVLPEDIVGKIPEEKSLEQVMKELEGFIGMESVKKAIREIAKDIAAAKEREQLGLGPAEKMGIHIVLTGNPGTGKTTIARQLGDIFAAINYLDSGHVVEVDRSKLVSEFVGETPKLVGAACDRAAGGILFIDEAYALTPASDGGSKDQYGTEAVETLMKRMEDDRGKYIVIAAGYKTEMERFLRANDGLRSRFNRQLHIDDYTPDELMEIYKGFFGKQKFILTEEAEHLAAKVIKDLYDRRTKTFANGREMRILFDETRIRQSSRLSSLPADRKTPDAYTTILPIDIPYEEKKEVGTDEIMAKLNALTGMKSIKDEITSLIDFLNMQKLKAAAGGKETRLNLHFVFSGNPGTGKTTVARIVADVFKSVGLLSRGHLVEVDKSKLVAGYSDQTAIKTHNVVDDALGGILFIDEAYSITSDGSSFGKECVDALVKRLEDDQGKFICIAAGYTKEMNEFIDTNPGLKSRFTKWINFPDYTPDELAEIFRKMVKGAEYKLDAETDEWIGKFFKNVHAAKDKNFGNAREVRNIMQAALQRQSSRVARILKENPTAPIDPMILIREDIEPKGEKAVNMDDIFKKLDSLIGLNDIKKELRSLASYLQVEKKRVELGGEKSSLDLHFIFTGNPGTGKTTVARIVADIFKAIGLLPRGQLIEVDRSKLVMGFVGQTATQTDKVVNSALGGILFIDEAYSLASGGEGDFGSEAINTLIKRLEDDKGRFICIAAGYTKEMRDFISMNSGLESRFNRTINFPDYGPDELVLIFKKMVKDADMILDPEVERMLPEYFTRVYENRDENFANARTVRNIFGKVKQQQSDRVTPLLNDPNITKEILNKIIPEDFNI